MSAPHRYLSPVLRAAQALAILPKASLQYHRIPFRQNHSLLGGICSHAATVSPAVCWSRFTLLCSETVGQGARSYNHSSSVAHNEPSALTFDEDPSYDGAANFDQVKPLSLPLQPSRGPYSQKQAQEPTSKYRLKYKASNYPQHASGKLNHRPNRNHLGLQSASEKPTSRPDRDHLGRRYNDYRATIKRIKDAQAAQHVRQVLIDILSQPGAPHYSVIAAAFTKASRIRDNAGAKHFQRNAWKHLLKLLDQLLALGIHDLDARACASVLYSCSKMKHRLEPEAVDALCARVAVPAMAHSFTFKELVMVLRGLQQHQALSRHPHTFDVLHQALLLRLRAATRPVAQHQTMGPAASKQITTRSSSGSRASGPTSSSSSSSPSSSSSSRIGAQISSERVSELPGGVTTSLLLTLWSLWAAQVQADQRTLIPKLVLKRARAATGMLLPHLQLYQAAHTLWAMGVINTYSHRLMEDLLPLAALLLLQEAQIWALRTRVGNSADTCDTAGDMGDRGIAGVRERQLQLREWWCRMMVEEQQRIRHGKMQQQQSALEMQEEQLVQQQPDAGGREKEKGVVFGDKANRRHEDVPKGRGNGNTGLVTGEHGDSNSVVCTRLREELAAALMELRSILPLLSPPSMPPPSTAAAATPEVCPPSPTTAAAVAEGTSLSGISLRVSPHSVDCGGPIPRDSDGNDLRHSLCSIVWGCNAARHYDPLLLDAAAAVADLLLPHLQPRQVATLLYCFGRLNHPPVLPVVRALADRGAEQISEMSPQGISTMLLGLAYLGEVHQGLLIAAWRELKARERKQRWKENKKAREAQGVEETEGEAAAAEGAGLTEARSSRHAGHGEFGPVRDVRGLNQLLMVHMWLTDIGAQSNFPDEAKLLPSALLQRCVETRLQPQYRPVQTSLTQEQVLAVALGLGLSPQVEVLTEDRLMDVDMVFLLPQDGDSVPNSSSSSSSDGSMSRHMQRGQAEDAGEGLAATQAAGAAPAGAGAAPAGGMRRVALQIDGPDHFCRDGVHLLGSTLWRNRALEARGYEVVIIKAAGEWEAAVAQGKETCEQLLLDKLQLGPELRVKADVCGI